MTTSASRPSAFVVCRFDARRSEIMLKKKTKITEKGNEKTNREKTKQKNKNKKT